MLVGLCLKSAVSGKRKKLIGESKTLSHICVCVCTFPRNLVIVNLTNWSLIFLLAVALFDVFAVYLYQMNLCTWVSLSLSVIYVICCGVAMGLHVLLYRGFFSLIHRMYLGF